ncbi:hypothetical protein M433DRAFT_60986 [Acidomyces richmondensis BFW]|nr:MAG: hypothetical protein FE78DRAFT_136883 [Acidomyces sp. 'richmondensis']KYG48488.1 hypothetical protein M433DRAFT_60986 [Acidomyces richmondensis BFW]
MLVTFAAFCVTVIIQDSFDDSYPDYYSRRVPLEAHIMSKCPDARDCLRDLILPTMQNVSRKVDFKLSYIGQASDFDDGVQCMHGQTECLGNIIELCAASLYPDPKIYLGFTMCLSNEYKRIPNRKLVEECALEHGISIKRLNDCVVDDNGALSVDRLRESFNRSAAAGVTKSCTVRLNGQTRCIRDGGKWSNCDAGHDPEDLVKDIMKLWNAKSTELGA